jgi:hypothetical protein
MVLPPEQIDTWIVGGWCLLTSDFGKPLMTLFGFGGFLIIVRSLAKLPELAKTEIVTRRNKQRNFRNQTRVIGWIAASLFLLSVALYLSATSVVQGMDRLCKLTPPPHAAATAVLPFLIVSGLGLLMLVWFQLRAMRLSKV